MDPTYRRDALLRLKTVRGHLDGLIAMVEADTYCVDVMKQVAAVQASLERVNRVLLRNHLETCVTEAIASGGGREKIAELMEALRFSGALTDFRDRAEPLAAERPYPTPDGRPAAAEHAAEPLAATTADGRRGDTGGGLSP